MKGLFSARWLTFYGTTIALVIGLFSVTTRYGETTLKAPRKIAGQYQVTATNLSGCLRSKTLNLSIEQSGIFLSGSLLETPASRQKPSLTGVFRDPNLQLSGTLAQIPGCEQSEIVLQAAIAQTTLKGNLSLDHKTVPFVAERKD